MLLTETIGFVMIQNLKKMMAKEILITLLF